MVKLVRHDTFGSLLENICKNSYRPVPVPMFVGGVAIAFGHDFPGERDDGVWFSLIWEQERRRSRMGLQFSFWGGYDDG